MSAPLYLLVLSPQAQALVPVSHTTPCPGSGPGPPCHSLPGLSSLSPDVALCPGSGLCSLMGLLWMSLPEVLPLLGRWQLLVLDSGILTATLGTDAPLVWRGRVEAQCTGLQQDSICLLGWGWILQFWRWGRWKSACTYGTPIHLLSWYMALSSGSELQL